ncbi:MAG: hypothetical protein BGP07_16255 [Rhizobiales bacterium 63-22]|nr:MAG: hypothetical protein BGP07_16255 [Rhizobiales bacterium 63-22]
MAERAGLEPCLEEGYSVDIVLVFARRGAPSQAMMRTMSTPSPSKALRFAKEAAQYSRIAASPPSTGLSFLPASADWASLDDMDMWDLSWRIVVTVLHPTGGLGAFADCKVPNNEAKKADFRDALEYVVSVRWH